MIGIELSHRTPSGRPTSDQEDALIELGVYLMHGYGFHLWYLHDEITPKYCHRWYVDHQEDWERVKLKMRAALELQEDV